MPPVLDNPNRSVMPVEMQLSPEIQVTSIDYKNSYPVGWDLKPGSKTHEKLVSMIMARARESERFMKTKHDKWKQIDEMLTVYIPHDEKEKLVKEQDRRKPISIVIPESYATLETILTYMMSAFGRDPMFKLRGSAPEDVLGAIMLEKVIEAQVRRSKLLLELHTLWRDAFSYGAGFGAIEWCVKKGKKVILEDIGYLDQMTGQFVPTGTERSLEDTILFEGSKLRVLDPYKVLPDGTVELHNIQEGEFFGWVTTETYNNLRKKEFYEGATTFNVQYLRGSVTRSSIYKLDATGRNNDLTISDGDRALDGSRQTQPIDVVWMYLEIIPKEYGLGPEEEPMVYFFGVAGDRVIIEATKVESTHDKFPVVSMVPDYGGHELMPVSRLEIHYGIQELLNFLINSHVYAIRKNLRNQLIVDPKSVNMNDVFAQNGIIRTRKTVWGSGVKDKVEQLQVSDITRPFMQDFEQIRGIGRNVTGAVDSLQGLQRQGGERVTAEEFRNTRSSALSRLQKTARVLSLQAMQDLGMLYAKNTQFYMTESTYVETVGRWQETLQAEYQIFDPYIKVSPFDLSIDFDVEFHDGSVEGGEFVDQWIQFFGMVNANPEVMMAMDSTRIALHIARLMGADNAQDFMRKGVPAVNATVMPDEQAAEGRPQGESNSEQF